MSRSQPRTGPWWYHKYGDVSDFLPLCYEGQVTPVRLFGRSREVFSCKNDWTVVWSGIPFTSHSLFQNPWSLKPAPRPSQSPWSPVLSFKGMCCRGSVRVILSFYHGSKQIIKEDDRFITIVDNVKVSPLFMYVVTYTITRDRRGGHPLFTLELGKRWHEWEDWKGTRVPFGYETLKLRETPDVSIK